MRACAFQDTAAPTASNTARKPARILPSTIPGATSNATARPFTTIVWPRGAAARWAGNGGVWESAPAVSLPDSLVTGADGRAADNAGSAAIRAGSGLGPRAAIEGATEGVLFTAAAEETVFARAAGAGAADTRAGA